MLNVTSLPDAPPVAATRTCAPTVGDADGVEVKVMVCDAMTSVTANGTLVVEPYVPSPAFVAVNEQVPLASVTDTVVPSTVQPVDAAALKLNAPVPLPPDASPCQSCRTSPTQARHRQGRLGREQTDDHRIVVRRAVG